MFPINVVEKETGISKYLLRMWERRYTFPRPERDVKGERIYSGIDVEKLKLVKHLMEEGYRPSKIMNLELQELKGLLKSFNRDSIKQPGDQTESVILITIPSLEDEVKKVLKNHNVKKILVVSSLEDLNKLGL